MESLSKGKQTQNIMQDIIVSYSSDIVEGRIIEHDGDAQSPSQPRVQIIYKNT
jgi:hypothetical protein